MLALPIAAHGASITLGSQTPSSEAVSPVGYINEFYRLALIMSGILAFGAIVVAAIQYTVSGNNPSLQGDAKDRITQAFLGLLLLLGASIILYTINPSLVNLSLTLPTDFPQGGDTTTPSQPTACPSGQKKPHKEWTKDGCKDVDICGVDICSDSDIDIDIKR